VFRHEYNDIGDQGAGGDSRRRQDSHGRQYGSVGSAHIFNSAFQPHGNRNTTRTPLTQGHQPPMGQELILNWAKLMKLFAILLDALLQLSGGFVNMAVRVLSAPVSSHVTPITWGHMEKRPRRNLVKLRTAQ
jgi:hypothetical protein